MLGRHSTARRGHFTDTLLDLHGSPISGAGQWLSQVQVRCSARRISHEQEADREGKVSSQMNGHIGRGLRFSIRQACHSGGYCWEVSVIASTYKRGADCHGQPSIKLDPCMVVLGAMRGSLFPQVNGRGVRFRKAPMCSGVTTTRPC